MLFRSAEVDDLLDPRPRRGVAEVLGSQAVARLPLRIGADRVDEVVGGSDSGEGGIEGKCALCGQYVTKGGIKFRLRSVLCPECAGRQERIGDPYSRVAGQR